jgi:FkbM family methyltransferase
VKADETLGDSGLVMELSRWLRFFRGLPLPRKLGTLERVFGESLSKHGVVWVTASNGVLWKLDLADPLHRWIVFGDYEGSRQMDWIRSWLSSGGVVIDSGANIGQMLLYVALLPSVQVHAFEPVSETADWLADCVGRYPAWDVRIVREGLSSKNGVIEVQVDGARTTSRLDGYQGKSLPGGEIRVKRLDDYAEEAGIERVRLWKLDVEGGEPEAIAGAERLLRCKAIDAILVEVSAAGNKIVSLLSSYGYAIYSVRRFGRLGPVLGYGGGTMNVIAVPAGKL